MKRLIALSLACLFAACANAADERQVPDKVAQAIRAHIPDLPIEEIRPTPMPGVYELRAGQALYYSDAEGRYLIAGGHLFETATHRDLTRERLEEINRVDWSALPLDLAIASGDPKAKLKLAVFTDPDCPYCRRLERLLKQAKGVRVYTFLYPLTQLHPEARRKAEAIWCSKNRHETLVRTMIDDVDPGRGSCPTPIDRIQALGRSLNVNGTPTLIAGDGRRMSGAPRTLDALMRWLERR